ncbi:Pentatricopeptide repeat-containing protein [Acorus gramineus]|uniref:Pentatricopeptide repeat-containing protein n=1 Tax=Acorus gramineus TaxID=55184 RepID=A0AAV9AYR3_ACOGR|nr:Pentatricopeptide repeat-containing protein [Acorus gramineus]
MYYYSRAWYLHLISKSKTLAQLTQIQANLTLSGLLSSSSDPIPATRLLQRLSSLSAVDHSLLLFSSLPSPDLFLHNLLISSLSLHRRPSSSLRLYSSLLRLPLRPDNFTFSFAISASASLPSLIPGRLLHAHSILSGYTSDRFVGSALVSLYLRFSSIASAEKVFDRIPDPDPVCWNTVISGLSWNSRFHDALRVFERMIGEGQPFDTTTFAAVLPAAAELLELRLGMNLHCLALKCGFESHVRVLTGLVSMYSKCGDVSAAGVLFRGIDSPDLIAYNAMISGYTFNGDFASSVKLLKELLIGERPNSSTLVGLIPVSSPFGHADLSRSVHGLSVKCGFSSVCAVSTALVTVYARTDDADSARRLFDELPPWERSLASWNAMISGYAQCGRTDAAVSLFGEMTRTTALRPNPVTAASVLSACAQIGAISLGRWAHEIVAREELEANVFVSTALIDMYAKCGSIADARRTFDEMPEKNVVSYNVMISGYGLHGRGREGLELFEEMLGSGVAPTPLTFLSVLYACSHSGLVEEGRRVFQSMVEVHRVDPKPEHYACMVDLLGRAGQLEEAHRFIESMDQEPGPGVLGALLGACNKHKNTKLARAVSEKLFELEPERASHYVVMSNIHSAERNYREAAVVREAAWRKRLAKTPGCSLIEVGGGLHVFTSGDRSHGQSDAIYAMLEVLGVKITEVGYRMESEVALFDVEEEEKENMVKVHSEKLAIAFGLLGTDAGAEIMVIKNLRVCLDCHNWTKFVSEVMGRGIVVRDANRFHHFKDGICSCGDFW